MSLLVGGDIAVGVIVSAAAGVGLGGGVGMETETDKLAGKDALEGMICLGNQCFQVRRMSFRLFRLVD